MVGYLATRGIEDYLEAIYILLEERGYARVLDIASRLGVKPPSVTEMLQKMSRLGLVVYEKYRDVRLTSKGRKIAETVVKRHRILKEFLVLLGVDEDIAEEDACGMEHSIHLETVEKLTKFVEFIKSSPSTSKWLADFRRKCGGEG